MRSGKNSCTFTLTELQLVLDKKDYKAGEDISVSIRAPYIGAGLITIERDKVYAQQWFKVDTQASVQKIKLPADFEGNGYECTICARSKFRRNIHQPTFIRSSAVCYQLSATIEYA